MENSYEYYNTGSVKTQVPFRIDPEFQNKIPPISEDEFKQLRENILEAGEVYEPLVAWDGVLVDGHNRWKVIHEHPEVRWRVRSMEFPDKWAAFDWMYKNQLGRRNLTDEQRTYTIGKMYEARKKSVGNSTSVRNADGTFQSAQSGHDGQVAITDKEKHGVSGEIAVELNIGRNTVRRAEHFAKGIDALREVNSEAADKVLNGKAATTKAEVSELEKAEHDIIEAFAQAVNGGKKPERKSRKPKTEKEKRDIAEIEAIMRDMRDPTTTPEFTIDFLIEDIELNGQTYVELLANTIADRKSLATDENKPRIVAAINKVVDGILEVRDSV